METDALKFAWKQIPAESKKKESLRDMIRENKHPVLKSIRRQLIIEMIAWVVFLFVYYDFFDGHQKTFLMNLLLVIAVILILVHSCMGYVAARQGISGASLKASLLHYLYRLQRYAVMSVTTRVAAFAALMFFFLSVVQLNTQKYLAIAGILVVAILQVRLLTRTWQKRIRRLKKACDQLEA